MSTFYLIYSAAILRWKSIHHELSVQCKSLSRDASRRLLSNWVSLSLSFLSMATCAFSYLNLLAKKAAKVVTSFGKVFDGRHRWPICLLLLCSAVLMARAAVAWPRTRSYNRKRGKLNCRPRARPTIQSFDLRMIQLKTRKVLLRRNARLHIYLSTFPWAAFVLQTFDRLSVNNVLSHWSS